jgi:hypothetical protein
MTGTRCGIVAVLAVGLWGPMAVGRFRLPEYAPVDRLIANATAYVQEHPQEAEGYYTLARIHYLAFINKSFLVGGSVSDQALPYVIPYWWGETYLSNARLEEAKRLVLLDFGYASTQDVPAERQQEFWDRVWAVRDQLEADNWQPPQPTQEQLLQHVAAAQWNFYQAIALDPNNALYYLGQASLGEQYLDFLQQMGLAPVPPAIRTLMMTAVRDTYLLAYDLALKEDLSQEYRPLAGLRGLVSYEAGNAYIRLWQSESEIPPAVQEKITGIKANLATLEALPMGPITPIVFSLKPGTSLATLLAPKRIVRFDLDGDGIAEQRPWLKPTTGLLVWDGDRDGQITSGRELFGSVTWWLFFSNGYRALDMLDDNRDGYLTAGELRGIAVWFDRNSNGRSDRGEIVSLESLGVTALGTRPTGRDGSCPMHASGIRLRDGRTLPSYDWIAPAVGRTRTSRR